MLNFLKICGKKHSNGKVLGWDDARLTFHQKFTLIEALDFFVEKQNFRPGIKKLNKLRNRIGHNLGVQLTVKDLEPLRQNIALGAKNGSDVPTDFHDILEVFTGLVCCYFAGAIWQVKK